MYKELYDGSDFNFQKPEKSDDQIYESNISKQNIVSSLIPVILLSIVVRPRPWIQFLLSPIKPILLILKSSTWLEILSLFLFSIFLLNFLNDIIILKVFFLNLFHLFESFLANTKPWLLDDQIRVFLLLLDHLSFDISIVDVVGSRRRSDRCLDDALSDTT